ncbi:DUF4249 domain-containing protein [Marinilongibacter aquaticus]|uniref:DUF4249 domain-containing protein n=1 Tax=Marinilongibacter aquaticus TaxID=2975157 RepID=UPI0021BD2CA3|nr:DUF4249 domain-containing protein [Marinilongibacter aquaticus]UBM57513.1 DUF4249 domain-containing protein [Marinilongibacter aquaticus]
MKKFILYTASILFVVFLSACEDVIQLDIPDKGETKLVVDAWITNIHDDKRVKLSLSQPYFDTAEPSPASGATVILFESDSTAHEFVESGTSGEYWLKREDTGFLRKQGQYALYIKYQGSEYASLSAMKRVPQIDSINYEFFEFPIAPDDQPKEGYLAQFYSRDISGEGDSYWIRTTKNGQYINDPAQISTAYDAGFSPNSKSDGLLFIQPIRQSINDGLYLHGDSIKVEVWSITNEAFYFLNQVRQQSSNGGIFATPSANVITNIVPLNENAGMQAVGFFGVSQVSEMQTVVDSTKAVKSAD